MSLKRRKCISHDEDFDNAWDEDVLEYKPSFFSHYTMQGCIMECRSSYAMKTCGCVPYYYPEFHGTKMCSNVTQLECLSNISGIIRKYLQRSTNKIWLDTILTIPIIYFSSNILCSWYKGRKYRYISVFAWSILWLQGGLWSNAIFPGNGQNLHICSQVILASYMIGRSFDILYQYILQIGAIAGSSYVGNDGWLVREEIQKV